MKRGAQFVDATSPLVFFYDWAVIVKYIERAFMPTYKQLLCRSRSVYRAAFRAKLYVVSLAV